MTWYNVIRVRFIPPIRSVSACKGCCLAPRNNHGSQNPLELKSLKTLEGGIWFVSCCIWIELSTKKQGLDHWRYMQALQGLHPLKPGLQGVYSLIGPRLAVKLDTRVPPSSHQRVYSQMFEKCCSPRVLSWSILYLGVPKSGEDDPHQKT